MSEEGRRADGADETPTSVPPVAPRPADDAARRPSTRPKGVRIPDDEVARPTPSAPPVAEVFQKQLTPMRIIPIEQATGPSSVGSLGAGPGGPVGPKTPPPMAPPRPIARSRSGEDESWTPYQPTAADKLADLAATAEGEASPVRPPTPSEDMIPIVTDTMDGDDSDDPLGAGGASAKGSRPPLRSPVPTKPEVSPDSRSSRRGSDRAAGRVAAPTEEVQTEDVLSVDSVPTVKEAVAIPYNDTYPSSQRVQSSDAVPSSALRASNPSSAQQPAAASRPSSGSSAAASPATPPGPPPAPRASFASVPSINTISTPPVRPKMASIPPPLPPAASQHSIGALATPRKPPLVIVPPHLGMSAGPSDAAKRKARPWWEELFNDDYIRTMAKVTDEQIAQEVDFVEDSLGVAKGGTMLDLGCGTGRHAIELARRGFEVVGLDLSLAMLARAADEAQERAQKLNFVQGDMRDMTFEEAFDGVFSWNTSFGFFDEEKNHAVIAKVHRSLKKNGQLLLDVINRDFIIRQAPSLAWFEGDGCVCMDDMAIDWITSRLKVKRTMMMDDGRTREIEYSIRVYSLHELGKLLHDHGFRVCEVSGRTGTPGVYFGNESPRTLILAEKR